MNFGQDSDDSSGLILAAEECPPELFEQYHRFLPHDDVIIRKLIAHGPVLVRGGRGSGKSALLIEAHRRMQTLPNVFSVYLSLRYLPLLKSDGAEYVTHFCGILSNAIRNELRLRKMGIGFAAATDQLTLQQNLLTLAQSLQRRIVLLFDDAAHIGREKPLESFFDLFRTLSSGLVSCKASIYPGVTKFGVRFDVYNDSTVTDISRSDVAAFPSFFPAVVKARYPSLAERGRFSDRLSPEEFANILGRAVVGNLRGLILACNRFESESSIGIPQLTRCFVDMATSYFWPLMEEVEPKLGVYAAMIQPASEVVSIMVEQEVRVARDKRNGIPSDRVLVHRQIVSQYMKIFEILEYLGFVAKREASRGMKSGGRGAVYAMNLCNLLEQVPSKRLTEEMIQEWIAGTSEPAELHSNGSAFADVNLPVLPEEHGDLEIFEKEISVLGQSQAYPYGLSEKIIQRLKDAGLTTVGMLAEASDERLDSIDYIGEVRIAAIKAVVYQAIWM